MKVFTQLVASTLATLVTTSQIAFAQNALPAQVEAIRRARAATYGAMAACEYVNGRMDVAQSYDALEAALRKNGVQDQERWLQTDNGGAAIAMVMSYMRKDCSLEGDEMEMSGALMPLLN